VHHRETAFARYPKGGSFAATSLRHPLLRRAHAYAVPLIKNSQPGRVGLGCIFGAVPWHLSKMKQLEYHHQSDSVRIANLLDLLPRFNADLFFPVVRSSLKKYYVSVTCLLECFTGSRPLRFPITLDSRELMHLEQLTGLLRSLMSVNDRLHES